MWYAAQLNADDEEEIEYQKALAEYHVALASKEGADRVTSVLQAREEGSQVVTDENFEESLQQSFGRRLGDIRKSSTGVKENNRLQEADMDVIKVYRNRGPNR